MRNRWKFLFVPPAIVVFLAVCGEVVMHLWNWLAPAIFGWRVINFWQALGLLILCRILFGGLGHRGGHGRGKWNREWSRERAERWQKMTPEEREKFRESLRGRCGPFGRRGPWGPERPFDARAAYGQGAPSEPPARAAHDPAYPAS